MPLGGAMPGMDPAMMGMIPHHLEHLWPKQCAAAMPGFDYGAHLAATGGAMREWIPAGLEVLPEWQVTIR